MTPARGRSRLRAALGLVLGCLLLATACGDDGPAAAPTSPPEPSSSVETSAPDETSSPTEASTSASPTSSPTPTIEKPTLPPEAEVQDHTGATAFFEYFWAQYNYALVTGDTEAFEALSTDECEFCVDVVTTFNDLADEGGQNVGGEITVVDASAPPGDDATSLVTAVLDQAAGETLDQDGETMGTTSVETLIRADGGLVYVDGAWQIIGIALEFKDAQ